MTNRQSAYEAVEKEIAYAITLQGIAHNDPSNDYNKSLECFALYIGDYAREMQTQLTRAWGRDAHEAALHNLRKIAALSIRAMQVHGVRKRMFTTPHPEIDIGKTPV